MSRDSVIDAEVHILHPEALQQDFAKGSAEPARKAIHEQLDLASKEKNKGIADLVESMSKNSVDHALIMGVSWHDPVILGDNNAFVAQCVLNNPDLLKGLYIPDPRAPVKAAKEIEDLDSSVFAGVKLLPAWQEVKMDDPALAPIWDVLEAREMPVMIHVDHITQSLDADTPFRLLTLLEKRPALKVLASHMGGLLCLYALMPEIKRTIRNCRFVTSVSATMEMVAFAASVNADNIIFGTDFPFNHSGDQASPLRALRELGLAPEDEKKILAENAAKFLCWPEASP